MNYRIKKIVRFLLKDGVLSRIYRQASILKAKYKMGISDEKFLRQKFLENTGEILDLDNPVTFNEKLQWLKLHNRNPILTLMADKYRVRKFIKEKSPFDILIPIVGGPWTSVEEIDYHTLPEQFVLKCNHDCGSVYICKDKSKFVFDKIKNEIRRSLNQNYYWVGREWPYKNIKPLIFAEAYMVDESGFELKDYKFHCFNGVVKLVHVDFGRHINHRRNIYTPDWHIVPLSIQYPADPLFEIKKPKRLNDMLKIASRLSQNHKYLRVDLYTKGDKIYFGELTFYHGGGMEYFSSKFWCRELGGYIDTNNSDFTQKL